MADQLNIDHRLNAIAMHLEIVARMQEANDRQIARLGEKIEGLTEKVDTLTERMIQVLESINTLGRIAGLHEERLDEHDGRIGRLEDKQ